MKVSDKMKETIKRSRKFSSTMWLSEQTGLYYIGYGHIIPVNKVKEFIGVKITKKMAEELFEEDMWNCQSFVNKTIGLQGHCFREDIPQNHFDVMCHSRYDIEKPSVIRYIRKKLNIINELRKQNDILTENIKKRDKFLKKLAVEYVLMGKECEAAHMKDAAIKNYQKALELYPSITEAKKKLDKLMNE